MSFGKIPMMTENRRPYTVQQIFGDEGRFGIVGPDNKRVAMLPVDSQCHAKDLAEALNEAHERRKQREAGGS